MNLDEIEKLCAEATPGPWSAAPEMQEEDDRGSPLWQVLADDGLVGDLFAWCNAEFIAASRTLLPKLVKVAVAARRLRHAIIQDWPSPCDAAFVDAVNDALRDLDEVTK